MGFASLLIIKRNIARGKVFGGVRRVQPQRRAEIFAPRSESQKVKREKGVAAVLPTDQYPSLTVAAYKLIHLDISVKK